MDKNENRPAIRFAGFKGVWEQRRLGEIAEFNPKATLPNSFEYVDLESVVSTDLTGHRTEQKTTAPSRAQRLARRGDVFYQTVRPYQKNNYLFDLPCNDYVFSTGYAQMRPNIDSCFLFSRIQEECFVKSVLDRCTGTSYPAISANELSEIEIMVPCDKAEQTQIGAMFKYLDHLLTIHQQEYDKLVAVKKSLLQKMFPREGETVPKIRFAGFTVAWERRRLGDVAMRIVRKNKNLESTLPLTISSLHGLVDQITYFNNRVASRDVSNYYLVKRGEFAYNKSYSDGFPWGSIKRLDRYEMGVLSTLYIVFALNTGIVDSDYLVTYYETNNWHNEIAIRAAEGARNHGLLNISAEDFFDTAIRFPKDIAEQAKIGDLFASLDHLLTIHQREYDKLVAVKKALLQKMFAVTGQIQKLNIVKGGLASVEKTPGSMEKLSENSLDEAAVGQDISNQELNSYPNFPHGAF